MIFIKLTAVGKFAQAAADRQLHFNVMPSMVPDRVRVTGVQDKALYDLALQLDAFPETGERWPGDTRAEP